MAFLPLLATHKREAQALFRRRQQLLAAPASPRETLRQLDWRLLANLQAVAAGGANKLQADSKPAALFVEAWALLHEQGESGLLTLDALFPELDAAQQEAVLQAVKLFPGARGSAHHPLLQAALLVHDEAALTTVDLSSSPDPLAAVLLQYRDVAGEGVQTFRPFYQDGERPQARRQAIVAGLIRKDPEAVSVAGRFAEEPDVALLLCACGASPSGPIGLALSGRVDAVPALLEQMDKVETAQAAAGAWFWLTGLAAPTRPRLQDVKVAAVSRETLPDAAAAQKQWQHLTEGESLGEGPVFFGKPLCDDALNMLGRHWCGQLSVLIDAHRAVRAGKACLPVLGWQCHDIRGA